MEKTKALIVLSGGQDSTTCLYMAKNLGREIHAVTFDYGQRHTRELDAAFTVGERAGVKSHELIVLGKSILKGTSPLVNPDAELAQYADHASLPGGLEKTFVPMRNQLFLTIAANRAIALGATEVFTGVCQEDFGGYPDCRQVFISAVEQACRLGNEAEPGSPAFDFSIRTPLMNLSKAETVYLAATTPGCFAALAFTHTGYDGAYPPTGKDHATLLREKGFAEANLPDPLILRAVSEGLMTIPPARNYQPAALRRCATLLPREYTAPFID